MEIAAPKLGVVMQRVLTNNRWQPHQWRPIEICFDPFLLRGKMQCIRNDDADARWLFPGFEITLLTAEAEGYFLNISSPVPCWFVMWRLEEIDGAEVAVPKHVTLSYNEAARLMDGGERVDTLPASAEIIGMLTDFANRHYRPEQKTKRRKPSFEGGEAISRMTGFEKEEPHGR
ncbi:MAG: DUF3305 domain-containing protein [Burkholderiaceae bacterium]